MSNYLAVATVTATLQRMLQSNIGADVPGATATTVRPDASGAGVPPVGLNIFLYEVAPNAVRRNEDLPTRSSNGQVMQRPAAALDLHYLMSFYGKDSELEPQRVLGSVVRYLHSWPLLTRDMFKDTVSDPAYSYLATSNLPDAVESVRFSPLSLSLEEMSKLWSIFYETAYILSVAYSASVVFIEEELTPVTPLPVRERQVFVVPFEQPLIEEVDPEIIASGATLTISGENLRGDVTKVKFGSDLATPATVTGDKITVALPVTLQPGVRTVEVIHDYDFGTGILGNEPHRGFESNVAAFILQPLITTTPPFTATHGGILTLDFSPPIGREQSVALLLNSATNNYVIQLPTRPPTDPPTATSFNFAIPASLVAGDYFLRVRVDGAESALEVDPSTFEYTGPKATIT
jgi:hypothetical protein